MEIMERMTRSGNECAALGAKLARAEVMPVYPITPSTTVSEYLANYVANNELSARMVLVESEHSALSACIAASLSGARTFTATSSQGLALMHEMLHYASGSRTPVVMSVGNRSLAIPWSIHADHQDSISQRDTGWIQLYCENNQEALDTIIQAYRIAEDKKILLPAMVCMDGFVLTHTRERVVVPEQNKVDEFLPPYRPEHFYIDPDRPLTAASGVLPEWYMEFRYQQSVAMNAVVSAIEDTSRMFGARFGRDWGGLLDTYMVDDADAAVIAMGTNAGTCRVAINELRRTGKRVGLIKLRAFRPFPIEELRTICKNLQTIAVLDRNCSYGFGGAVWGEVKAALYGTSEAPIILDFISGLGGRDASVPDIERVLTKSLEIAKGGRVAREVEWLNLKGEM
jgi:pyruvate ferredoxin oxidoreductase alpha subunit